MFMRESRKFRQGGGALITCNVFYIGPYGSYLMRGSRKFCQMGSNFDNVSFFS